MAAHRRSRPGIVQRALRHAGLFVVSGDAVSLHGSRAGRCNRARATAPLRGIQSAAAAESDLHEHTGRTGARGARLRHPHVDRRNTRPHAPDNVRSYLLAGTQHGEAAFPPAPGPGQALPNPMPQARRHARAAPRGTSMGQRQSAGSTSRHPELRDGTLVAADRLRFPAAECDRPEGR